MASDYDKQYFGGNREKAIQRDGEKCVNCGMTRDAHKVKYGRNIEVDHIDGMGSAVPKRYKNNAMSNLRTLCRSCHAKIGYQIITGSPEYEAWAVVEVRQISIKLHSNLYKTLKLLADEGSRTIPNQIEYMLEDILEHQVLPVTSAYHNADSTQFAEKE